MLSNEILVQEIRKIAIQIIDEERLLKKLNTKKAIVKMGADPTRPDIHLGHTVVLRMMRKMQDCGHEIVFIIGDYTAAIGDPSGKSKTRPALTIEETRASGQTYFEQVIKILDPAKTRIVYNSEWLEKLSFREVISLMSKYTLAQLLEREDFQKRFQNEQSIGMHEMLYPLVQGYDSVAIHADIELGGTDQTFNLLVGRELQKAYGQEPQTVITFPLLVGLDGKQKMSKSLDNYIGIDEAPEIMYEKAMKIPDTVLEEYFRLTTDIPKEAYIHWLHEDIVEAHRRYAAEIVRLYHGEAVIADCRARYESVAKGQNPKDMPCFLCPTLEIPLVTLLHRHGLIASNSEGRRLIQQHGLSLNGCKMTDTAKIITENDFVQGEMIVKLGKNRYYRFVIATQTHP